MGSVVMQRATVVGVKVAIVSLLLATLVGQVLIVPLFASEAARNFPEFAWLRAPGIAGCALLIGCVQVVLVSIWKLLSMVASDRIFSVEAFRWVDVIIGALAAFSILILCAGLLLTASGAGPGPLAAPLVVSLVAGIGGALLMLVMRGLLVKASALQQEMAEVI